MPRTKETLLTYFDKADDVKKEVIVDEGKRLIREKGYGWKSDSHEDLEGKEWIDFVHARIVNRMASSRGSGSDSGPEAYDEFKLKLASRVNNELTSIRSKNVPCQLSHSDYKKFEALKKELKAKSNGECLSQILWLRTSIKKLKERVFSISHQRARDLKQSYVSNLTKDHAKVKKYLDRLAKYEVLKGNIDEVELSAEQKKQVGMKTQEFYKRVPRLELTGKSKPQKGSNSLQVILAANEKAEINAEVGSSVAGNMAVESDELVTIKLPKKELEKIYEALRVVAMQADSLERNTAFNAIEQSLKDSK